MRGRGLLALLGLLAAPLLPAAEPATRPTMAELSVERRADGTRQALVRNRLAGPIHVRVHDGARPREVIEATLEAGETRAIGRFGGEGAPDLRLEAQPGAPQLLPPGQRGVYAFPLPAGSAWRLTQGFGGRASHRDAANFHALDFAAAQGTPVLAAREGTVMQVVDTFTEGGTDEALKERMNLVRVLHADGSMGLYAHVATGSARVQPGDGVQAGQALAAVGSVGWSSAPHLHFSVQANDGRELLSLPFRMAGPDGRELDPTP
ncbi:M23 family metallopeptidase [Silanimonas sp.]|jgi:murein DD-endopeptidase MepM/ murein hydrolase activator NlpD|uniref:M23 family metallopeptidase n=1 Tax=Silanimonas sp. TaxID=1929290 RepID=UPI0037CB6AC1